MALKAHSKNMKKAKLIKFEAKPFPHFDKPILVSNTVNNNLKNPSYITSHSFYPFIHYTLVTRKYNKNKAKLRPKNREIFYAAHMDGYIFKYYGEMLNNIYNKFCEEKGLNDVSLAYRNNKNGKSNIHFAAEAIQFITNQKKAFIFVSDFSSYFDNLDHALLKERLISVIGRGEQLSTDWWNVYKHVTRYSWVEKYDIERDLGKSDRKKGSKERYYTPQEFREFRKRVKIYKNETKKGIPQGTAISAVLANIYAYEIDQKLNQYASIRGGIYRRYSDDIIVVIPIDDNSFGNNEDYETYIKKVVEDNKIEMGANKTSCMYYYDKSVYKKLDGTEKGLLDYLGFAFDGVNVSLREKSLYKYYHRAYRKIEIINKESIKRGKNVGRKKLYSLYTHLGRNYKGYGNFISYAKKAHFEFEKNENINSLIYKQIKRHWNKIQKRLIKV
ncbi:reverse transcriptase domain-containing protein [Paenibacillus amylolyticus]|uniref:reverse transcriptase domain-containing protein n=1 Tax=Paenibacillus amylolyticus TaxID=1451 RepID=UPI0009FB0C98|nr:reverse transcriptase domain-containing protein [Paenibacillus amylolyticus]